MCMKICWKVTTDTVALFLQMVLPCHCKDLTPEAFKELETTLPAKPGVYRYYDADGNLLYVGKAKHLRKG